MPLKTLRATRLLVAGCGLILLLAGCQAAPPASAVAAPPTGLKLYEGLTTPEEKQPRRLLVLGLLPDQSCFLAEKTLAQPPGTGMVRWGRWEHQVPRHHLTLQLQSGDLLQEMRFKLLESGQLRYLGREYGGYDLQLTPR
jgi:hypothetical protein